MFLLRLIFCNESKMLILDNFSLLCLDSLELLTVTIKSGDELDSSYSMSSTFIEVSLVLSRVLSFRVLIKLLFS
jgi:hypothetical protein